MADQIVEQLTREALEAAKEGKWDEVARLYECRSHNGQLEQVSPQMAEQLMEWDHWMTVRLREARAANQAHMDAIQNQQRKLAAAKRQWGCGALFPSRHLLSV